MHRTSTHIGINAMLHRPNRGGVERVIGETVHGLACANLGNTLEFFVSDSLRIPSAEERPDRFILRTEVRYSSRIGRITKEQVLVSRRRDVSLWHHLGYVMPPFPAKAPLVVSIYDIIALTHPHLCTTANRYYYGFMLPRTIRRADRIVVPSEYVKRRIDEMLPASGLKIRVLPLPLPRVIAEARNRAPEAVDVGSKKQNEREYLLFLGDLGPKKNIPFLLKAYSLLSESLRSRHPLRICGRSAGWLDRHRRMARDLGVSEQVQFTGYAADEDLPAIYRNAKLLLYPSLEEGYGYPPLESMALGTPAVVSDMGALPEVAGGSGAAVSALDPEAFSEAMAEMLDDDILYGKLQEEGRNKVLGKTWVDYADELAEIYEELL